MKTFPVVSPLLQDLDRQGVAQFGNNWDDKVCEAIRDLRNHYTQLRVRDRKLIDYSSLQVQMAYGFMYVGANANCLFQVLDSAEMAHGQPIWRSPEMKVTSWGGGPGSDLLALVRLLRKTQPDQRPKKIAYRVLDKQPNWHEILKSVAVLQLGTVEIEVSFEAVDVTLPGQWQAISNADDDMLIMNFFVSEVCSLNLAKSVWSCLAASLASLKKDCIVVFIRFIIISIVWSSVSVASARWFQKMNCSKSAAILMTFSLIGWDGSTPRRQNLLVTLHIVF
jgi:hypothetical protein